MKHARSLRILLAVAFAVKGLTSWADPSLSTLFTDHMVLQRGRPLHIWGKANAGEKLTVDLAGHSGTTSADASGRWSVHLPALGAGGPFTLTVRGNKEITIKDVMIGEVWLASGQSNMTFALSGADGAETEVPQADYPQIRLFTVPQKIALSPQDNTLAAHWEVCTPDNAKSFSAVSYFFARDVYRSLGIPIGIVESAWPGTTIEEWIAPEALRANPALKPLLDPMDRMAPDEKKFADNALPFALEFDDFELVPASSSETKSIANFDDGTSRTSMGGTFAYSWADAPDSSFDLVSPGRGGSGFAAQITGRLDGSQTSTLTVRYKLDNSPMDLRSYTGIRFWVRGSGSFRFRSLQPTIYDWDNYTTASVTKATSEWRPATILFRDLRQEGWGVSLPFTQDALSGFSIENLTALGSAPIPVAALFEGMISPLLPYGFRGALWYQGESNALKAHQYHKLLPTLIENWRQATGNKDLEFLIVQLPNHGAIPEQPVESAWAELREAQLMTLKHTSHTGLAVTIDVGDPANVHPHRKLEVGQRLALWALGTAYQRPIVYSGPIYESMQVHGKKIVIHFTHVGAGLEGHGGGQLQGFAIAGSDRKFHWADARIEANTVVVSSPEVTLPVAVRYAWADSPPCNLFNKDGLPASPFRTDDWPGITEGD